MSIAHELSSDITTALVDTLKEKGASDPQKVAEIVLDFHLALRPLESAGQTHRTRHKSKAAAQVGDSNSKKP
jgi:hypothetical protein